MLPSGILGHQEHVTVTDPRSTTAIVRADDAFCADDKGRVSSRAEQTTGQASDQIGNGFAIYGHAFQ